ncbi:Lipid Droplet Assembly Factor 1 [Manis pentadactyla]|nr:Lipid Droplet Assembly Factor 1 [Manis pentadactyla]
MVKEEPLNTSKDLQELQRKLSLLIESLQSKVVAFMKSPVGQFLDRHSFLALIVLEFISHPCWVLPAPRGSYLRGCFCGSYITRSTCRPGMVNN